MRVTLGGILRRRGFDVAIAADGYQAIEEVKKAPFDIAILDIKMPGIDGVDTFIKLKEIQPNVIVFLMTAFALDERIQKASEEGVRGIIYKPFEAEKIFARINDCI